MSEFSNILEAYNSLNIIDTKYCNIREVTIVGYNILVRVGKGYKGLNKDRDISHLIGFRNLKSTFRLKPNDEKKKRFTIYSGNFFITFIEQLW